MKQTTLDLNGPILSFIEQPSSVSVCDSGSAIFTGLATAAFPTQTPINPASNTGTLSYQWYANGYGALTDGSFLGATISGSGTTTLTITGASSPTISGLGISLGVDYVPSAYSQPVGSAVTVGTGRSTGNALNEILFSNVATLTVYPTISITTQPTDQTAAQGRTATFNVAASVTDTTQGDLSYQWTANGTDLVNGDTTINGGAVDTASGSNSTELTLSSTTVGIQTISCTVSHPTSCSSPIFTNTVNFNVVSAREIIKIEEYNQTTSTVLNFDEVNLFDGEYEFANRNDLITFYAPEKDVNVEMDFYAAAGASYGGIPGGEGGFSRVRFTMPRNVEFLMASFNFFETGYIYRQSSIMMVVGQGGNAGPSGAGGPGGGVGLAGGAGSGRDGGSGGFLVPPGELDLNAYFGSDSSRSPRAAFPLGGKVSNCGKGGYWVTTRGFSPCQTIGDVQFYQANGTLVSNSAVITRGYKAGLGFRQTAGAGDSGARGGSGCIGGSGGRNGSGGGGASGYHDGTIEVIESTLGGHTSTTARCILRLVE